MGAGCATSHCVCLIFCLSLSPGHMPYSGQISVAAHSNDTRCTWSGTSRTGLNGMAHAAEACTPPFRAGQDRPRPGCRLLLHGQMPPLADRITLCDREVRGERAPTRRSARLRARRGAILRARRTGRSGAAHSQSPTRTHADVRASSARILQPVAQTRDSAPVPQDLALLWGRYSRHGVEMVFVPFVFFA